MATDIHPKIAEWQAVEYEVGMVVFSPSQAAADRFPYYRLPAGAVFLGVVEADALCLMDEGSLQVYDHEVEGRVLCRAAGAQEAFLEAFAELEKHFQKAEEDDSYREDEAELVRARKRCVALAGGEEFTAFYTMMVGA